MWTLRDVFHHERRGGYRRHQQTSDDQAVFPFLQAATFLAIADPFLCRRQANQVVTIQGCTVYRTQVFYFRHESIYQFSLQLERLPFLFGVREFRL